MTLQPNLGALLLGCLVVTWCAPAQPPALPTPGTRVAAVGDQSISEADLLAAIQPQIRQIRIQEFEIKSKALDNLINQRVLDAEAAKKGVTRDALLEREADSKAVDPTDGDIETYYLGQKDRINRPLEDVKPQLRQGLKQAKIQQARQNYIEQLRKLAAVQILLEPPRAAVGFDAARLRGKPDAAVTIVEFSDFQCPYCRSVQPTLQGLLAKPEYQGKLRLAFRDYPLRDIHPQAQKAAEASRCAGEQGKFWQFHDLLFANPGRLENSGLLENARAAGLNAEAFESCLSNGKFAEQVNADLRDAVNLGVSGTPGFFINGIFVNGSQPAAVFERIIDRELGLKP